MTSGPDPKANIADLSHWYDLAMTQGTHLVVTPEVTNCVSTSRAHQRAVLRPEAEDPTLAHAQAMAQAHGIPILLGSLAVTTADPDGRFANRAFFIDAEGQVLARYDKLHMFDVDLGDESFRESAGYRPGSKAVVVDAGLAKIGLTICYDLRFPHLFTALAKAGAQVIVAPSAFAMTTGQAHWHVLLQARAIETGCFIVAPAQTGDHGGRASYGHSLVVNPWGEVIFDAGVAPGVATVDLDLAQVSKARRRIPSLTHIRPFEGP